MSDPLLSVEDLQVRLGEADVLESVSLTVDPGEVVGLVGPNGAGKTTLIRAVNGVLDPDAGTVRVEGEPLSACSARERSRRLATVPQDTSVSFAFGVEAIVEMGRTPHRRRTQFGRSETDRRRIEDALERTDTAALRDRPLDELSGGERQRVFVARALAQDTPLLLLDEPTASLDVNHQVEILGLIRRVVGDGRAALAAIHDLDLAARFCDRLALLHDGEIVAFGPPESVLEAGGLDAAFDTETVVSTDPVTGTPTVTARPDEHESEGRRVHVLGGGRVGARAIAELDAAGHEVSAGVLREGDLALETVRALSLRVATTPSVGPIDSEALARAHGLAEEAAVVVLADLAVGPSQWALDVAEGVPAVVAVEERPLADRLHAGERARERYERLRERGTVASLSALPQAVRRAQATAETLGDD